MDRLRLQNPLFIWIFWKNTSWESESGVRVGLLGFLGLGADIWKIEGVGVGLFVSDSATLPIWKKVFWIMHTLFSNSCGILEITILAEFGRDIAADLYIYQ